VVSKQSGKVVGLLVELSCSLTCALTKKVLSPFVQEKKRKHFYNSKLAVVFLSYKNTFFTAMAVCLPPKDFLAPQGVRRYKPPILPFIIHDLKKQGVFMFDF